jgi:hypothetical protein
MISLYIALQTSLLNHRAEIGLLSSANVDRLDTPEQLLVFPDFQKQLQEELKQQSKKSSKASTSVPFSFQLKLPADYDVDKSDVRKHLVDMKSQALLKMQLGYSKLKYNPYIRRFPFPPFHLNVNYLLDPRALVSEDNDRELNRCYDEHKDGQVALKRADPLIFPNVAQVPFDFNDRAMSSEDSKPWWQTVRDFFSEDSDEAESDNQ